MSNPPSVKVYDSQSEEYHQAFQEFLDHTDQKARCRDWLERQVQALRARRVFIDAGAGNGKVTAWFAERFGRTLAIEPNPSLREELRRACPSAEVIPEMILAAKPSARADLVLCSHVLYYIPEENWLDHLVEMASWLAAGGVLVVILQDHETDCMKMLDFLLGKSFDLTPLVRTFQEMKGKQYAVDVEQVASHVTTSDFESACTIAEFMLNLLPMPQPPARAALEDHVKKQFALPDGGYRFSCHQDFVRIQAKA